MRTVLKPWLAACLLMMCAAAPRAQTGTAAAYPTAPIRLIVPFVAGGPTDVTARLFAEHMSRNLGQPVVIENRPGADSAIGAQQVAHAAPDGYTLLLAMDVTMVMNPITRKNLSYNPLQDFDLVSLTSLNTSILVVPANGPKTARELIDFGRAHPGKLNYGAGIVTTRLASLLFSKLAGFDAVYVPYKGSVEVVNALIEGSVDFAIDGVSAHYGMVQAGKERALAKLNKRPLMSMPDLKPLDELVDLPKLGEISTWAGIIGPKGMPPLVVDKLQKSIVAAANDETIKAKLLNVGIVATSSTPDEFKTYIGSELAKWSSVVAESGIQFTE
jgi:tripartite-type tricarboxylate transporter receptor subunit TctC